MSITQLEEERRQLMQGKRTHSEWVQVMERLEVISAEILKQKQGNEIVISAPPLTTHEERMKAKQKLISMNQFRSKLHHAAI